MNEPAWVSKPAILVLHDRSLALHGGAAGIRDEGLLDSALERPRNRHVYEAIDDVGLLAATYAVGVASNHPFVDGNKRAALLCALLFLRISGWRLAADPVELTHRMFGVAAGKVGTDALAAWFAPRLIGG